MKKLCPTHMHLSRRDCKARVPQSAPAPAIALAAAPARAMLAHETRPDRPMHDDDSHPVPEGRIGRMLRLGGMTAGILGGVAAGGVRALAQGDRPRLSDLILTPATAQRMARDLGRMRGAAMKLGQMLALDAGSVLPPQMTAILSTLGAEAPPMPPRQLQGVLDAEWGAGWRVRFARFDVRPFAAASIGQVHRAQTKDGRDLAIKVQYPGVRASIDSDIDNLAALIRLPGGVPKDMDLAPLLAEAKAQLHREADYLAEARHLTAFHAHLAGSDRFLLPDLWPDLTTPRVLAMSFVESQPLSALDTAPQALRDRVAGDLIDLVLRELFVFRRMQTDPNLANYRFDPATGRIVLLDFGATMEIDADLSEDFRRLLDAALGDDPSATEAAMRRIGYFDDRMVDRPRKMILRMFDTAMTPIRQDGAFDFGASDLIDRLRDMGLAMGTEREMTHIPPAATLFLHRKIGGIYLLAARLRARVPLRPLAGAHRHA